MHRVLSIPEVLLQIFVLLPRSSNACNARVCKAWSGPALDITWCYISDAAILFRSLAPMILNRRGTEFDFVRPPVLSDWTAFLANARRVHRLNLRSDPRLSADAISRIATTRSVLEIFPNARWIDASCFDAMFDPLFFSASVKKLRLVLKKEHHLIFGDDGLAWKFGEIAGRMPNLEGLTLFSNIKSYDTLSPSINRLLEGLPGLVNVDLPARAMVSSTLEVLSRMKQLRAISVVNRPPPFYEPPSSLSPELANGCFPSLTLLHFQATLSDATRLLQDPNFPSRNLVAVILTAALPIQYVLPQDHLSRYIAMVVERCLAIGELRIILNVGDQNPPDVLTRSPVIRFADIAQVLQLRNLTILVVDNATATIMTDADAKDFAHALPNLKFLNLTRRALVAYPSEPSLTLRSLIHFAEECPDLHFLGLYLDASTDVPSPPEAVLLENLRTLYLGYSFIVSVKPVVWFLSRTLPSHCCLGVLSDVIEDSTVTMLPVESTTDQHRAWRDAQKGLSWVQDSRVTWREEEKCMKSRVGMLEKEVAVLRSQLDGGIERS